MLFRYAGIALTLFLAGCVYVTGGDSEAPEEIELADLQGCYYNADESHTFSDVYHYEHDTKVGGTLTVKDDSVSQNTYCRKLCIEGDKITDLTFTKKVFWTRDGLTRLSTAYADSSTGKGTASILGYDSDDGHFYNNLKMSIKYKESCSFNYSCDDKYYWLTYSYLFEERDGVKSIYHHGRVEVSSKEYNDLCAE